MELYQLRTFKMVAEEGNLTRASAKLHTSQPAVSSHIKNLEDELGVLLFKRTPKGMVLTDDGTALKAHADQALLIVDAMASHAGKLQGTLSGNLRVGLNTEPDFLRVSALFSAMQSRHPELQIHLLQAMTGEVLNKLEEDSLDAGFMFGENESEKIHSQQLARLKLVVGGPKNYSAALATASPSELATFPWIITPEDCPFHTVAQRFFTKHGMSPSHTALTDQESVIKAMIKSGAGLSLLLKADLTDEDLEEMAIWEGEELSLDLSIACLKRRKDEQLLRSVFSTLAGVWEVEQP